MNFRNATSRLLVVNPGAKVFFKARLLAENPGAKVFFFE